MYDICNADTFKNCKYWLESIRNFADENVVIALVGKKYGLFYILKQFIGNKADILHVN